MATTIDEGEVMAMQNPPHPGGIVRRECLEPLGLSVTWAAAGRGVGAVYIRRKVKGRKTVTTAKGTRA